jgi:RNA polymerase sigma factor (sigma-70 family)
MDILTKKLPVVVLRKDSLKKWVFGVARNQGLLEHRARAQNNKALGELAAQIMKPNTSPTEGLYAKELRALLLEEIEKLPSRLRRVIEHDLQSGDLATPDRQRSLEEFARQEGIQPGTVWSRRFRAVAMLRDGLTARLNPPHPSVADSTTTPSSPPA